MSSHENAMPVEKKFFTNGVKILFALVLVGCGFALYRIFNGLGSITNLDNQYPLGLWIGVDVASGVALAAGGFTTGALVYIFHR
ncbi:MAG: Ni/Fe-hydrogenase cytochrome b subunit, partial [Thermodesulfobacteriota bacterium]|nr:Ni/Fe-hydrogenase cytochrome b subunit [Thermodesulfobacteriota bacterium]